MRGLEVQITEDIMKRKDRAGVRSVIREDTAASCFFRSSVEPPYRKALIQITERCNLHCVHCFISAGDYGNTMPVEIIRNIVIPRLKQCRVSRVTLTGGEPFLHPDIVEIAHLLRNADITVGISTNGTAIDFEQMKALREIGGVHTNVSLHGFRSESHNRFTGSKIAFQTTVETIRQLGAYGLLQGILVTPNRFAQIEEYVELCEFAAKNGATYVLMNPLSRLGRGVKSKEKIGASNRMMRKIREMTARLSETPRPKGGASKITSDPRPLLSPGGDSLCTS